MCGVPYHSSEGYIARLIAKGYKVSICEQTQDPAAAKGLVERDIVRVITPGTLIESSMLEEGKNNFLSAISSDEEHWGLALCDLSTGEFFLTSGQISGEGLLHLQNELGRFSPSEAILSPTSWELDGLVDFLRQRLNCLPNQDDGGRFTPEGCHSRVISQFFNATDIPTADFVSRLAAGGLLSYLYDTQKTDLGHITTLQYYQSEQYMELDLTARQTLELTKTLRTGEKRGSLLWVLDKTKTPMGGRLIRSWMERPLLSPIQIGKRQQAVSDLVSDSILRGEVSEILREVGDLERVIGRVVYGTAGGRDLVALAAGLGKLPSLQSLLERCPSALLQNLTTKLDSLPQLRQKIADTLVDEPPFSVREGGLIRDGYHPDVDELRDILQNGGSRLTALETRTKEETGIRIMKIRYNKVFGYFIEVPKSQQDLVPDSWVRKQTTVNSERYISQELKELEHLILSAQDKISGLEYQIFSQLRQEICDYVSNIQTAANAVAQLDVLTSFAQVAASAGYCMPQVDTSSAITIIEGRHPVVEKMGKGNPFVPNDTHMDGEHDRCAIITGPNMAGKSTYMRQVALIVLMAQMGSFVPAQSARIGVVDRVFTRIGASDDLSAGQSTFMVEMSEVAALLKSATSRSLLILDEIGRGTSTYDGMSIARAVVEHCADKKKLGAKTLFATHYHELTVLEGELPGVTNYNIAAKKKNGDIIFLRKILRGGADQSYGIEVAKLAGVPNPVIRRAHAILAELEAGGHLIQSTDNGQENQVSLAQIGEKSVLSTLRITDTNGLSPLEALNLLASLKAELGE